MTIETLTENLNAANSAEPGCSAGVASFVVPALNEQEHLAKCLKSLYEQVLPAGVQAIEVIVVDNQSSDGTADVAASYGARVISVAPGSPSRSRNVGAREAMGDWLAFVDADSELAPDWLLNCAQCLTRPETVAVGAVMQVPTQHSNWVQHTWHALAHAHSASEPAPVNWLPAFNLLIRRQAFDAVGGFDERLRTCEDCDLSYRLAEHGTLVLEPRTSVIHHGESRTLAELFRREAWRSRGNLRLAARHSFHLRNWISAIVPVVWVLGIALAAAFALVALFTSSSYWYWSIGCFAVAAIPFVVLCVRQLKRQRVASLSRMAVVLGVYLAARSVGLVWSLPRVSRSSQR
jgi:GT2 family glycosyltransferase